MKRLLIVVGLTAALGGLFLFGLLRGEPGRNVASSRLDQTVPSFTLPLYPRYQAEFGPVLDLSKYLGERPLVVNFWASWCGPCYEEAPELQEAWRQWGDELLFIGIQTQDRDARAEGQAFLDQFDLGFPNAIDNESRVSIDFGLFGVPETFFIRADGTLMYKHTGPVSQDLLEEKIRELTS